MRKKERTRKVINPYILIIFVAFIAILVTVVTVILMDYSRTALVGEASYPSSGSYQKGGAPDPTAIYTPPKTFCETVKSCNLSSGSPPVSGSLKVVDAAGKEVGILVDDAPVAGRGDVIKVFDTNIQKFLNYNLYNVTNGTNDSYIPIPSGFSFYFETEDCSGQEYILTAPTIWGGTNVGTNNPYVPMFLKGILYAFPDYLSINISNREGMVLRSRTESGGCYAFTDNNLFNLSNPIYAGYYLSTLEEVIPPTYKGPLSIVYK